jgi:alkaline phosphatase
MYEAIAADFLLTEFELIIGGGLDHFTSRKDGRNLVAELQEKGYTYLNDIDQLEDPEVVKLVVLTASVHNPGISEGRGDMLVRSAKKAVELLNRGENGFFLMIEGSQIDWACHDNLLEDIVEEVIDFDKAIGEALDFAEIDGETLVIVTGDHETGGLALHGFNPDLGIVEGAFTTTKHTGVMVPVLAYGPGAEEFAGIYENTEIFTKMVKLLDLE